MVRDAVMVIYAPECQLSGRWYFSNLLEVFPVLWSGDEGLK
jgi:hypothetical protein